jgi:hypothetical protein
MSRINEILLVSHTHHDVGYTHTPDATRSLHWRAIAAALRLCDENSGDERARLRWTIEVSRPLLDFLELAPAEDVQRLRRLAGEGLVAATGGYLNMTQLVGSDELERSYAPVERLRGLGLDVRVVQHGDVNGLPWGTVPAMRRAGLTSLVMALNPNHGRAPFEQPSAFWWEGPDGSQVLTWLSLHYGLGAYWGILYGDMARAEPYLCRHIARLDERDDYPFDFAMVHLAHDNRFPSLDFQPLLRQWNKEHPDRPMRTATITEAMDKALATAATADLPVHRGEWADWWAHGHGSSAREVAIARQARSLVAAAQSARALAMLADAPSARTGDTVDWDGPPVYVRDAPTFAADTSRVYDDLLLFEEHTWGSRDSVTDPHGAFTRVHWHAKATFAYRALDRAWQLYAEGLHALLGAGGIGDQTPDGIVVYNPAAQRRSEPVFVAGGEHVVVARDLPPTGVMVCEPPSVTLASPAWQLETDRYTVRVDPGAGGIASLIDRSSGREWVDGRAGYGLGAVVYEQLPAGCEHPMATSREYFHPDTPGPEFVRTTAVGDEAPTVINSADWTAIQWRTSAPTLPDIHTTLRLYPGLDAIDLTVRLTKQPCYEPEGVYVAFPFAIEEPRFLLETGGAVYEADREQLPDTCRDWYSVQHAAAAIGPDGAGVLWGTVEAPLVQLGGFHTGRWARKLDARRGHINAWLMNNLYFTNFRAAQAGVDEFSFRLLPRSAGVDAAAVRDLGARLANAPVGRAGLPHPAEAFALLDLEPAAAVLCGLTLTDDGDGAVARIASLSDQPIEARLRWLGPTAVTIGSGDQAETAIGGPERVFNLALRPNETKTLLLRRALLGGEQHG